MFVKKTNAYSIYLLFRFSFSMLLSMATVLSVVYHLNVVRLNAFQLVLVGTVLETACFLLEIPTGVVADLYSRRRSVLIGIFLYGIGFVMEGALPWFATVWLAQIVWGCGDTFITGALEAWIASEETGKPMDEVFLRGGQLAQLGSVVGVVSVAWIGVHSYYAGNELFPRPGGKAGSAQRLCEPVQAEFQLCKGRARVAGFAGDHPVRRTRQ